MSNKLFDLVNILGDVTPSMTAGTSNVPQTFKLSETAALGGGTVYLGHIKSTSEYAQKQQGYIPISSVAAQQMQTAVAVAAPPAVTARPLDPVPMPEAEEMPAPVMSDALRQQYVTLTRELGIMQPGLVKDAARAWFGERGIRSYDIKKVSAYLTDQYGPAQKANGELRRQYGIDSIAMWVWRPLRNADSIHGGQPSTMWINNYQQNGDIASTSHTYAKPIPLPVLLTVKEVIKAFPGAQFYVSDQYERAELRPVLDPFLLVMIDGEAFVIERWDEPAYRE